MDTLTLKTESGFTFLEVMVAFSIVALVLVGIYQLQTQNIALGIRSRFNVIAPMLADLKATEIVSGIEDIVSEDSGDFGDNFPGYSWQARVSDMDSEILEETAKQLKKIDVYVDATDQGVAYHLCTYFLFDGEL